MRLVHYDLLRRCKISIEYSGSCLQTPIVFHVFVIECGVWRHGERVGRGECV